MIRFLDMSLSLEILLWVGAAVAVFSLSFEYYWRRSQPSYPTCAMCGYNITGLPTCKCPECGLDLSASGIVLSPVRTPVSLGHQISIWTLALFVPAATIDLVLSHAFAAEPYPITMHAVDLIPNTRAYAKINIAEIDDSDDPEVNGRMIGIVLSNPPAASIPEIHIDLPSLVYRFYEWDGIHHKTYRGPSVLDEDAIGAWMDTCGIDTDDKQREAEAKELMKVIQRLADGAELPCAGENLMHYQSNKVTAFAQTIGRPIWLGYVQTVFWLFVWVLGILYLCRRARKAEPLRNSRPAD